MLKIPRLRLQSTSLYYFDAVRRERSIRAASRQLNVAASAINRQILSLESEIEAPLFDRLPSGMRLTAAGELLARHVMNVLRDAERFRFEIGALRGLHRGHVEILSLEGLCHHLIPATIGMMEKRYSGVTVGVGILGSEYIPTAIAEGEAHLGLAFQMPKRADLRQLVSIRVPLGIVVPARSKIADRGWITLKDLNNEKIILPKANFANRDQLRQAGLEGQAQYECGSIELMKQLVLRGLGVVLMTRIGFESEIQNGQLIHVPIQKDNAYIYSELCLFARSSTILPASAEMFAFFLTQILESTSGQIPHNSPHL